ncbi:MAG: thioredoxin [Sodaliphilus sp.]
MESFTNIINRDAITLVDFFATWCGPCKMMHPVLSQLKEQLPPEVRILKIDVDQAPQVASAYGVQAVPTLILFRGGNVLWRHSGALSAADLKSAIARYL